MPERPNMWYIFEKRIVQGYQKSYSHMANAQIQKYKFKIHKYTYTAYDEVPKRSIMWYIFFKENCSRISKIIFPLALVQKFE